MSLSACCTGARRSRSVVALGIAISLGLTGLGAGSVARADEADSDAESEVAAEPTVSMVDLLPTEVDTSYVSGGEVTQDEGDSQQESAVTRASTDTEAVEEATAGIVRADIASDNVIVGVTWDSELVSPELVKLRFLSDGIWSQWIELDSETNPDDEAVQSARGGTEAFSLTNADAVEVVGYGSDEVAVSDLQLTVVDVEGGEPVDNSLAVSSDHAQDEATAADSDTDSSADDGEEDRAEDNQPEEADPSNSQEEPTAVDDEETANDPESSGEVASSEEATGADGAFEADAASLNSSSGLLSIQAGFAAAVATSSSNVINTGVDGFQIISRSGWGADESQRSGTVESIKVKGAIVHHFESSNNYTEAQVPGIIRGTYYYHAVTRKWGDIGYNFVVDKFGNVYEGRYGGVTKGVKGAQAYGANSQTFGISVIGGYTQVAPSTAARQAVAKTIAWKLLLHGVTSPYTSISVPGAYNLQQQNGRSITIAAVSAHRDVGQTDCPGDAFYAQMGLLRKEVASYMQQFRRDLTTARFAGADRYSTNLALNQSTSTTGQPVFVVTGSDYADALTASPAVASVDGSLFLAPTYGLSSSTLATIKAKQPSKIYVVGGEGAVSKKIVAQLYQATGVTATRVAGSDRYATAAAVAARFFPSGTYSTAFVATGENFPDALTAAAAGGTLGGPVLLVTGSSGTIPSSTREALNRMSSDVKVLAVGGTGVISEATLAAVKSATPSHSVVRLWGSDRYATNSAVNSYINSVASAPTGVWVATGADFADALSAAPSASQDGQRLVLSPGTCVPEGVLSSWLLVPSSKVSSVSIVGGESAVDNVITLLPECG